MTTYRITRRPTIGGEPLPEGWVQQITFIATGAVSFPLPGELAEKGGVGYFNGFEVKLEKGDVIERVEE